MSEQSSVYTSTVRKPRTLGAKLAMAGLAIAVICAALAVLSGLGYRIGLWHFRIGFTILQCAFWGALAAGVMSIAGLLLGRRSPPAVLAMAVLGLAVAAVTAYIPWSFKRTVGTVPMIHDITTDVRNPPQFVAAAKLRKPGDHPVEYDGRETGSEQREAYPDIVALVTNAPKEKVFEAAKATLSSMGLEITDANPAEGRLEAVDTTLLYGFKDDMVVRIQDVSPGTRVDVRSKSRVGRSDLGVNAKRIRTFLSKLRSALPAA